MKTVVINMSEVKDKNVFTNATWKEMNEKEIEETMKTIKKYKR